MKRPFPFLQQLRSKIAPGCRSKTPKSSIEHLGDWAVLLGVSRHLCEFMSSRFGTLARSDHPRVVPRIPLPDDHLVGEKTPLAPRAVARQLQSALVIVPGAAHMIPITHPNAILDAIRKKRVENSAA
jgi:pimeloyl-ACP methyl ester carboxylesterase